MPQPDLVMQCGHQLSGGVLSSSTLSSLQHIVQPLQPRPGTMSTCSVMRCCLGEADTEVPATNALNQIRVAANVTRATPSALPFEPEPTVNLPSSPRSDEGIQ